MDFATRLPALLFAILTAGLATAQRTPDEALRALQDGNRRFAADRSVTPPVGEGVRRTLARGQSPFAIVLCCADSRVPPEHVFNAGLGDLFVVRVAGHCADPETVASIEYAVEHLGASLCVVLGHEQCGAVAATLAGIDRPDPGGGHSAALQQLLEHIEPAARKARTLELGGKTRNDVCEEEHAHATVQDCLRRSELLRRYAALGRFRMVAARYHLQSGEVEWLPNRPLPQEPAAEPEAAPAAPAGVPPHVALRLLQAGHRRFLGDGKPTADLTAQRREVLTHGQQPLAIVLTCADSRVAPEHVFDAGLGELFVVRIAGNTLNDDALASIEYAAGHLGASLLVVMGHTRCGAVQAAAEDPAGQQLSPNLRALLLRIEPAVAAARAEAKGRDLVDLAVRGNALRTVSEARSRSALLRALEREGRFAMLSCVYDLAAGDLEWLKDAGEPAAAAPATAGHEDAGKPAAGTHGAGETHATTTPPATPVPHAGATPPGTPLELPVLDWATTPARPAGETQPVAAHPVPAAHEAPTAAPGAHAAAHEAPVPHAAASPHTGTRATAPSPSWDPIVLVGIGGVASLLAAAVLAMKRR